jgi:hypothetical protein
MAEEESKGWAAAHKRLTAVLATMTAIVGLATGVLTLRGFFAGDDEPAPTEQTGPREPTTAEQNAPASEAGLSAGAVAKLEDDVQLNRFTALLGKPASRRRLQNDEWLETMWQSPDVAVAAFSNRDSQVVAYTVTSLGPDFTPAVEHLPGGIRLRRSVFADVRVEPSGATGVFPPSGEWSYEELYRGAQATDDKSVVLAASFAANADDEAATEIDDHCDCLGASIFEDRRGCPPERVRTLRSGLRVTSMTVGAADALEALADGGAAFHPPPDTT